MSENSYDVVVVGAGIGGVSAAVSAARLGARVALLEAAKEVGGTGVHSPVGLVCTWFDSTGRPINRGLYEEVLPYIYDRISWDKGVIQTYDETELKETYLRLLNKEPLLDVFTSCPVTALNQDKGRIHSVENTHGRTFQGAVYVDSTADGNLAALAGAEFQQGRSTDGKRQPGTLTFRVDDVDFTAFGLDPSKPYWARWDNFHVVADALLPYYHKLREKGGTSNPRENILCFPDRKGRSLLFNQTRIAHVDPSDPASVEAAIKEGRKQVDEFWEAIRHHPAFAKVSPITVSQKLGVREGRRIVGDYILTGEDCLGEARFEDMVAACGYALDIHDPSGSGGTSIQNIPGSGYYHIPYRSLMARDFSNLLLGSRCLSGTHEAHSSYRVMPPISAVGQAAGTAAAIAGTHGIRDVRGVDAAWIRHELRNAHQFVEGACDEPVRIPVTG